MTPDVPGRCEVRIEHQSPVDQCSPAIDVVSEMGERMAASREGDGIVLAQLRGPASQSGAFGELSRAIGHPAVDLAPEMTPRRHRIGRRVIRVELKRLGEQWQSVVDGLSSSLV